MTQVIYGGTWGAWLGLEALDTIMVHTRGECRLQILSSVLKMIVKCKTQGIEKQNSERLSTQLFSVINTV